MSVPKLVIEPESPRIKQRAGVDASSIENEGPPPRPDDAIDAGIVLRLDVKRMRRDEQTYVHQFLLTVASVSPEVKTAGIQINHLCDLGILRFTTADPDFDADVICRTEEGIDLWTEAHGLRRVWDSLTVEIGHYEKYWLLPPIVPDRQRLAIAVVGMDYFNRFVSPVLRRLPPIYRSTSHREAGKGAISAFPTPPPPLLFR